MRTDFSDSDTITIDGFTYSADMATVLSVDKGIMSMDGMLRGVRYIGEGAFAGCENLRIVRIPETVIRIEDFAFKGCCGIQELHLPNYMEYVSPLAFMTTSNDDDCFYLNIPHVVIPKDSFIRYAQIIPQYIKELDNEEYGVSDEELKQAEGYDDKDGLRIAANEEELYRIIAKMYDNSHVDKIPNGYDEDVDSIEKKAYDNVLGAVYNHDGSPMVSDSELVDETKHTVFKYVDEIVRASFHKGINDWFKFNPIWHPFDIFIQSTRPVLSAGYNAFWEAVGRKCPHDEEFEEWLEKGEVEADNIWLYQLNLYVSNGHTLSESLLRKIVYGTTRLLFRIGFSYAKKYREKQLQKSQLELFSAEEMRGGISVDFFDKFVDAYLESMKIVSRLDDEGFYRLSAEYEEQKDETKEMYYLHCLPDRILSRFLFWALGEMIELRHYHNNHLYSFEKARITVPYSFNNARERFVKERENEMYVKTDWVTSYHPKNVFDF